MQIRVVKEEYGLMSVIITSQGTPPLPAVGVQHLTASDVEEYVASVLADFKRARVSTVDGAPL